MRSCSFYDGRRRVRCTECSEMVDLCKCVDPDDAAQNRTRTLEGQLLAATWDQLQMLPPTSHLDARILSSYATALSMIVKNNQDRSVSDEDIRRQLVRVAAEVLRLAAHGTPEYAYPSNDG